MMHITNGRSRIVHIGEHVGLYWGDHLQTRLRLGRYSLRLPRWHPMATFRRWFNRIEGDCMDRLRAVEIWYLERYTKCAGTIAQYWGGEPFEHPCGKWRACRGSVYCERCHRLMELTYPQGWRYYPGDTCRHGVYVGGCGADLMCGRCEAE